MQVIVRDNNVDQAMRVLKKRLQREGAFRDLQREGAFREMKPRKYYEKPSEERVRRQAEAVRRSRKNAPKQAIREGVIAAPKSKPSTRSARPGQRTQS